MKTRHLFVLFMLLILLQAPRAFAAASAVSTNGMMVIPFPDPRLAVHGLPWFEEDKPVLRRLPARLKEKFRPPVWSLAQSPSGGRIRFRTDATRIGLSAQNPDSITMHHMTSVGQNGFDLYVGTNFINSAWPDKEGRIEKVWPVSPKPAMRDITIYLPLYKPVTMKAILLNEGARVEAAPAYRVAKPVVYYGSSITQGGCAANAGLSCQAIVSRWLDTDFVNLGFSGNGLGEPDVAKAICEIDASCIVLDFWGNPPPDLYRERLPVFTGILREKFPTLPILVLSPFYFPAEATSPDTAAAQRDKRATTKAFVAERQKAGDRNIYFVDGLEMLNQSQSIGLVDGVHCNSLGFYFNAKGLEPHLRKALKL